MSSIVPSHNPFISGPLPCKGETPQERLRREREEARAKAISDAIDEQIQQDRVAFRRYQRAIKVLLLGQSESGKSTMIKNFQLMYAYDEWVRERSLWKTVIHLNLIRSVTTILEIMDEAVKEHHDRPQSRQRSFSPSLSSDSRGHSGDTSPQDLVFNFSERHRLLRLRLKPLSSVQRDFEEYLGSALEPDQVGTAFHTAFPCPDAELPIGGPPRFTGFPAFGNSSRKTRFSSEMPKRSSEKKAIQDLHNVLYCCGSDIKQLWADDAVQQVLNGPESPLESSGFSMEDIDRLLERDYEPSDKDVVKARLRTVGVQEYHFSIPRDGRCEDWILYDVGGSRTSRHAWCSYFDDINSIIFLAPVSCFDQCLAEDPSVSRLEDSLLIWRHVCNSKLLANIQLILLLNKIDLLKKKLESGVRFDKHVVSYRNSPNDVPSVTSFLKQRFKTILKSSGSERCFHCHLTSATDTKAVATIQTAVYDGIVRDALQRYTTLL